MANTISVMMTNALRNVVSKQRIRYKEKGFNLDLAYICDNIIAMGYPADNIEKIYRNRLEDVYKFLEENHSNGYYIYNLCSERSYDINKFHNRVATYPFEDHNPPTIELIQKFCSDVDSWLKSDENNVAAVHCKAGKGRTGTMICCYLLYSGLQRTAEDALAFYDEKRTKDKKGVTIPSQRRYVQYFSKLIDSGLPYEQVTLKLCEIRFTESTHLLSLGSVHCSIYALEDTSCPSKQQLIHTSVIDFRKKPSVLLFNSSDLLITGDIKVELTNKTAKKSLFHFWFNTYFVLRHEGIDEKNGDNKIIYTLHKSEIDDAHKDKEHKCFSEDFEVKMIFSSGDYTNPLRMEKSDFMYYNNKNAEPLVQNVNIKPGNVDPILPSIESLRIGAPEPDRIGVNTRSIKGISSSKNLDKFDISYNSCSKDHGLKKKFQEPLVSQRNSNKYERSSEGSKMNEILEYNKAVKQPSCKSDNSNLNENKCHLSIGRNNSNTSSNLSNNSKQCIYEDDWESGESTYL